MITAITQTKGGVGKTTLAVNIAIDLSNRGTEVLLVDADDQKSAALFTMLREEGEGDVGYTLVELSGKNVRNQIIKLAPNYDHVVIDVGGRDTAGLRAALTVADIALIPFQPRSFDIWTQEKMEELVEEARVFNEDLQAYAVLNSCDPAGSDNAEAKEELKSNPTIGFLNATIGRRKAFSNSASMGLGVAEMKSRNSKACSEMAGLVQQLIDLEGTTRNDISKTA